MKKLILFLICAFPVLAVDEFRTATLAVTNSTVNGSFFNVAGNHRFGTNARSSTTWLTNGSPMWSATNIFNQLGFAKIQGLLVSMTDSNKIAIGGINLTLIATNQCFALTWTTNSIGSNQWTFMGPFDDYPQTKRITNANELIYGIGKYGTNGFPANTNGPLGNYATLTHTQAMSYKFFIESYWSGGTISNSYLINVLGLSGIMGSQTNGYRTNSACDGCSTTNEIGSYISPIVFTGVGTAPRTLMLITNLPGENPTIRFDQSDGAEGINLDFAWGGVSPSYFRISALSNAFGIYSTAGALISLSPTALTLGNSSANIVPGAPIVSPVLTNSFIKGTNILDGSIAYPPTNHTTIASGNNIALEFGTHYEVSLDGSISGAVLCGIVAKESGRFYRVRNNLGSALTITQDTSDPVAANRFSLYASTAVSVLSGGFFDTRYNSTLARWEIENVYPASAVATNIPNQASAAITNNTASFTYSNNPIVSGLLWTNTTGTRCTLKVVYFLTDSAVSGAPSMAMTNISSGEFYNATNFFTVSVAAGISGQASFDMSPGDYFISTNKSSGSSSATVTSSFLIKQ